MILPLAEPALAARHAVSPPKAIVLFGPPGTGKTTFAKGIASRLGWPFVEIQPSELAGEGAEHQARLLAQNFDRVLELSSAVTFVDEVEDLASIRHEQRRVSPSVTNEFLKQIPRLRNAPQHLLVCATNWVGSLDSAFLRPGRFDYVLPVGPPDEEAREAIWRRYLEEITDRGIDLDTLVQASRMFTPADIEFAAHKAAPRAFEREHFGDGSGRATTEDFLAAVSATRPRSRVKWSRASSATPRRSPATDRPFSPLAEPDWFRPGSMRVQRNHWSPNSGVDMAVETSAVPVETGSFSPNGDPGVSDDHHSREVAHAAFRGTVAAMAMTGMRVFTVHAGIVEEPPPQAIFRQKALGLLRRAPRKRRPAVIELAHWAYGAGGGAVFGMLPASMRRRAWAGPAYGFLVWIGFEAGIAPALGLKQAKELRLVERAAFAVDHLLYGLVLSEMRRRPQA